MKKKSLSLVALLSAGLWFVGCQPAGSPEAMKKMEAQEAKMESMEKRVNQLDDDLKALSTNVDELSKKLHTTEHAVEKTKTEEKKITPRRK